MRLVVLNYGGGAEGGPRSAFWQTRGASGRWVDEPSVATDFETFAAARKVWKTLEWKAAVIGDVNIVEDYGLESEHVAL